MKKRNVLPALAAAALLLQLSAVASPALAVGPEVTFTFSPISGVPGTKINFSGNGCTHDALKARDGVFVISRDGSSGIPVPFVSDGAGRFTGQYDTTDYAPGRYTTVVSCETTGVGGIGDPYTVTPPPGSTYFPISPARVLDTREGIGTGGVVSPLRENGIVELRVTGVAGVPTSGVTAIALNVTATNASGPESHLKVWPTGSPQPGTSNLNFNAGTSVPNLVIARVGTDGKVSIRNNVGTVDVVADIQGWYSNEGTAGSKYTAVNPARLLDTRNGTGTGGNVAQVGELGVIQLKVTDVAGVPADASAVVLNVTVDRATGPESFLTVWPSGSSIPTASNLNFVGGPATTNLVVSRVGSNGNVSIFNHVANTDVIADVQGWYGPAAAASGSTYFATNPARILDSRDGTGTPGGAVGQLGTDGTIDIAVAGVGGVPSTGVTAVVLNVTVADSPGPESFLTLFPAGTARQMTSNLNFSAGETVPNLVIVRVADGKVSMYNHVGSTNVIADVQGWFAGT